MKRTILSLCFLVISVLSAQAQENFMIVQYPIGFPTGGTKDYIEKTSWRGLGFGYRHLIDGKVAVGVDLSWQTFYERKALDTYTSGTASISGTQYRYSFDFPITAQADYVLNEGKDLRPFMGFGIGALYAYRVTDFGMYRFTEDPWQFLMKPEVGLTYYMSGGSALIVSASYYAAL